MRARSAILLPVAAVAALILIAALLGKRQRGVRSDDQRASTYLSGPGGVSGVFEALPALGVSTQRMRDRPRSLANAQHSARTALLVLAPSDAVTPADAQAILEYNGRATGGDLVLAGAMSRAVVRCFGYAVRPETLDSARVRFPSGAVSGAPFFARATLVVAPPVRDAPQTRPGAAGVPCAPVVIRAVDTLLVSAQGPIAMRLERGTGGHDVILVADAGLFRNRQVRETQAGPFVLSLLARRYDVVLFDEYHHGFGPSGSLGRSLASWSLRSPLGWGVWQAMIAGTLALLAAGVRFGPPREALPRKRRASLEHVRALATALATVRGHDVAISVLIRGLRRRLNPGVRVRPDSRREWLDALEGRSLSPRGRDSVRELKALTTPGQDEAAVLRAANAVEDVWDTLRHSAPTSWRR